MPRTESLLLLDPAGRILSAMRDPDAEHNRRVRRFISAWTTGRVRTPVAEIHAAALDRFARDANFVKTFWPIAIGCDEAATRELLRAPLAELVRAALHTLDQEQRSLFTLRDGCWVRRDAGDP